jgi:hypothetical protein
MLMSASATADAMGVFLSFMNFPLDLGLWMGATLPKADRRSVLPEPPAMRCGMQCQYTTNTGYDATNLAF